MVKWILQLLWDLLACNSGGSAHPHTKHSGYIHQSNTTHGAEPTVALTPVFLYCYSNKCFFLIKPTDALIFPNLFLSRNSTCFRQFLCPSSGVFYCTFGKGICHARLITAFKHVQDVLESCYQTCMTYTCAECTVENSL